MSEGNKTSPAEAQLIHARDEALAWIRDHEAEIREYADAPEEEQDYLATRLANFALAELELSADLQFGQKGGEQ